MAHGDPVLLSLYIYAPNAIAPIIFTVAFAISAVAHIWQCTTHKAWKLIGLHPFCAVLFTAGYALRSYQAQDHYLYNAPDKSSLFVFIVSQVLIFVCPPLLELANYHLLGRIFHYVPHKAPLPPNRVLAIFGVLMMVVEVLNALGVALAANPVSKSGTQAMGKDLILAAISIQIALIIAFIILAGIFHHRCRHLRSRSVVVQISCMYASMGLILIRCIYRLVEHTGTTKASLADLEALRGLSPILRYEAFFYVFEAALMLLNSAIWNIWHPGRFLPRDYHVHLGPNGLEVVGKEEPDARPTWKKVLHVLTFGALFGRERRTGEFRELPGHSRGESGVELHPAGK